MKSYLTLAVATHLSACLLGSPAFGQAPTEIKFMTDDEIQVAGNLYRADHGRNLERNLLVVAPGFGQFKDSKDMKEICPQLAVKNDVLCFDFRGTGQSTGVFDFGAKAYKDLQPILLWARKSYQHVSVLGMSLGAYATVRAAHEWPDLVWKILLISCPTDFLEIVTSGGEFDLLVHTLITRNNPESKTGSTLRFRWGPLFPKEPNLAKLQPAVSTPAAFLVGARDPLVKSRLSQVVFESMTGPKTWDVMPDGDHADVMYIQHPDQFLSWIKAHL